MTVTPGGTETLDVEDGTASIEYAFPTGNSRRHRNPQYLVDLEIAGWTGAATIVYEISNDGETWFEAERYEGVELISDAFEQVKGHARLSVNAAAGNQASQEQAVQLDVSEVS